MIATRPSRISTSAIPENTVLEPETAREPDLTKTTESPVSFSHNQSLFTKEFPNCKPFYGWTIGQVFEAANNALGGCCTSSGVECDPVALNECITLINQDFIFGKRLSEIHPAGMLLSLMLGVTLNRTFLRRTMPKHFCWMQWWRKRRIYWYECLSMHCCLCCLMGSSRCRWKG